LILNDEIEKKTKNIVAKKKKNPSHEPGTKI
jgi:hypothetical protein